MIVIQPQNKSIIVVSSIGADSGLVNVVSFKNIVVLFAVSMVFPVIIQTSFVEMYLSYHVHVCLAPNRSRYRTSANDVDPDQISKSMILAVITDIFSYLDMIEVFIPNMIKAQIQLIGTRKYNVADSKYLVL